MLSYTATVLLIVFGLCVTGLFALFVNHFWPIEGRKHCNDAIGCQLSILGTTYAVVLGFMLFNVWTEFRLASVNVSSEAASALQVWRLADALPPALRDVAKNQAHAYAEEATQVEWPVMNSSAEPRLPEEGDRILARLLALATNPGPAIQGQDQFEAAVSRLYELRRLREEQYCNRMPLGLWALLIVGAVLVIGSTCLLGGESVLLYYVQVFSLAILLIITLAAIADIDHPFSGSVTVRSVPFQNALHFMER